MLSGRHTLVDCLLAENSPSSRPLVSPEGWAGAGVGIGMVLVVGIPVIENKNIKSYVELLYLRIQK